ncbi:MAG: hypothetical protein MJ090_03840 [Clostridia bacterium]|nr:hypothetical protein [Clostridia bacterium]
MKRIISAVILLMLSFGIYFSGLFVINKTCNKQIKILEKSISHIQKGNIENAVKLQKELPNIKRLTHYVYKERIDEVKDEISKGQYYLAENDDKQAIICYKNSINLIKDIKNEFFISFDSFF